MSPHAVVFSCLLALASASASLSPACLFLDASTLAHRAVLAVVLPELLRDAPIHQCEARTPSIASIFVSVVADDSTALSRERYSLTASLDSLHLHVTAFSPLSLAYALHAVRHHLALYSARCVDCTWSVALATLPEPAASPAYSTRTWSEEGQLLDMPDRGYYTPTGDLNTSLVLAEAAALEGEVIPALLRLGFNSLTILQYNVEDYLNYDTLPTFLPGAPAVYNASDPHRRRTTQLCNAMSAWIAHLNRDYGVDVYLQPYEFSFPLQLCGTPGAAGTLPLNCTLGSPDLLPILQARYSELATCLPALTGVVATVADSWTPRAGYGFATLWSSTDELGQVAAIMHDAIVTTAGLRMVFRLWTLGKSVDWSVLVNATTPDTEFSVKQTSGDFLLDFPLNPLLNSTAPSQRPFMVLVDVFRQYNGWTSSVCWMGSQWAPRLAIAHANGVRDLNAWGAWAPGCTWPDSGPELLNSTTGYKSWRGWWDDFRTFNGTKVNGGFSLGAQANAYLISRLAANVSDDPARIARDFGTLFYGEANADAIAALLDASFNAWLATSYPEAIGDFTLFWTMIPFGSQSRWEKVAAVATVDELIAAQNASNAAVADMLAAAALVNASAIPASNPAGYAGMQRAVAVAQLYLPAYFTWREAGLRNITAGASPSPATCQQLLASIVRTNASVTAFGAAFPVEDGLWAISSLAPGMYSVPSLGNADYRTMAEWVQVWTAHALSIC